MNDIAPGTLYGIGVGPGEPDLIPVKAVKILQKVDLVFAAASTKNRHSQAVDIARDHIPKTTEIRLIGFPMTKDQEKKKAAWQKNARTIIAELERGRDAAFLTLGDTSTYATYGYLMQSIQRLAPHLPIVTVPGITSYQAAAARVNLPLVEAEESLLITSGAEGGEHLRKLSAYAENVVFLKAYRNTRDITAALEETDMLEASIAVVNCGRENEEIIRDIRELENRPPGYWTLIIAKKNSPNGSHTRP